MIFSKYSTISCYWRSRGSWPEERTRFESITPLSSRFACAGIPGRRSGDSASVMRPCEGRRLLGLCVYLEYSGQRADGDVDDELRDLEAGQIFLPPDLDADGRHLSCARAPRLRVSCQGRAI
eukprot:2230774-Pyramimonas_sp.AAC.1